MDKLTIALLTSGTSLIVALISILGILLNTRKINQTTLELEESKKINNLELEKLKQQHASQLEQVKRKHQLQHEKQKLFDEQSIIAIESLKEGMKAIQIVKDEIYFLLNQDENVMNSTQFKDRFTAVNNNILESYQKAHPNLNDNESQCLHSAKNLAFHAFKEYTIQGNIDNMKGYRAELNVFQQELKGFMNDRMWDRIKGLNV